MTKMKTTPTSVCLIVQEVDIRHSSKNNFVINVHSTQQEVKYRILSSV